MACLLKKEQSNYTNSLFLSEIGYSRRRLFTYFTLRLVHLYLLIVAVLYLCSLK
jgi:hypothetical protein